MLCDAYHKEFDISGVSTVHVQYNTQETHLPVIITKGDGVALIYQDVPENPMPTPEEMFTKLSVYQAQWASLRS